jgi:AcrR family transcriptional regulator
MAEAEGWDAVTTRRLADRIEYSQPVLYSHFPGKGGIIEAVAVEGFAELRLILQDAREAAGSPEAALRELAGAYVGFALEHPALYDAMFTLNTELPLCRPEAPRELQAAFAELRGAVTPLAGGRDPDTLAEVAWSALHGVATLTRAHRLRPDYHQARLTMLVGQLAGVPG